MNEFVVYRVTLITLGLAGLLLIFQLIVADLAAIRGKHKAGYPIPADSNSFMFRAARAHLNTNESIGGFTLIAIAGMFLGANPAWLNLLAPLWLASRVAHMLSYYANAKATRSLSFAVGLIILLAMAGASLLA